MQGGGRMLCLLCLRDMLVPVLQSHIILDQNGISRPSNAICEK